MVWRVDQCLTQFFYFICFNKDFGYCTYNTNRRSSIISLMTIDYKSLVCPDCIIGKSGCAVHKGSKDTLPDIPAFHRNLPERSHLCASFSSCIICNYLWHSFLNGNEKISKKKQKVRHVLKKNHVTKTMTANNAAQKDSGKMWHYRWGSMKCQYITSVFFSKWEIVFPVLFYLFWRLVWTKGEIWNYRSELK